MKIANTNAINYTINELINIREINAALEDAFTRPLNLDSIIINSVDLKNKMAEFQDRYNELRGDKASQGELALTIVVSQLLQNAGLSDGIIPGDVTNEIIAQGRIFREGEMEANLFYQATQPLGEHTVGAFTLATGKYEAYQLLHYNSALILENGVNIPRLAMFDHDFIYPCILENGEAWMTVTPNEIFTIERSVRDAQGKVLTLGLGLGYFAYMAAMKDDVSRVTVIERQAEVIELFEKFIRPLLECGDKITVIQGDAIKYMEELEDGEYDYCFADIWMGNTDTDQYLALREVCSRFRKTRLSYWIEDSLVSSLMGYVTLVIVEEGCRNRGIPLPDEDNLTDEGRAKLAFVRSLLENESADRPDQLMWYADYRNIMHLLG